MFTIPIMPLLLKRQLQQTEDSHLVISDSMNRRVYRNLDFATFWDAVGLCPAAPGLGLGHGLGLDFLNLGAGATKGGNLIGED
jgi:hypothetical protein